ncbi:MAG: efflux RND transporter periplasmic adaptor subunit [Prevotellaceae bacterium]|jgi:hypothetical protein|nr:efflux RND transporter periplasmic adaptor subunit [Prevotellaceae bacterium]
MKKKIYVSAGILAILAIIAIYYFSGSKENLNQMVKTQRGVFEVVVTTTGELLASSNVAILGPEELRGRNIRAVDIKILDLIPEGSLVDSGDYVASLDPSVLDNMKKDVEIDLEQWETTFENSLIDTSINLKALRDNIQNLKFNLEEAAIVVEQSVYEPPATQRKAQNDYEKAMRTYEQEKKRYTLRKNQELGKLKNITIVLERKRQGYADLLDLLNRFQIYAPASGMIIYHKIKSGEKRTIGSTINPWDRVIALLPDLSKMQSKTYVNEVDISKVKTGQNVRVGVDAFPDKRYTGTVTSVANTGEQLRNSDAKVFEVMVKLNESDEILRPLMTSSNEIIVSTVEDAVFVSLEAIHVDSVPFVYRTNGTKQVVVTGEMNDGYRIIEQGLEEGDEVYLSTPPKPETFRLAGEELIPIIRERESEKKKEEELRQAEERKARRRNAMPVNGSRQRRGGDEQRQNREPR